MLWRAVERVIPDIRQRVEIEMARLFGQFFPSASATHRCSGVSESRLVKGVVLRSQVGTPLTHRHFLRTARGHVRARHPGGRGLVPRGPRRRSRGLYCCGGLDVPGHRAAGGCGQRRGSAANTLVSVEQHLELLDAIGA